MTDPASFPFEIPATLPDETPEVRLKRLIMRSQYRGTREMDLILGPYARAEIAGMDPIKLDLYEALLNEYDPDLYQWVSGQLPAPEEYTDLVAEIAGWAAAHAPS